MKKRNIIAALLCSACLVAGSVNPVFADASKVVTLGADLTDAQKQTMMKYFNVSSDQVQVMTYDLRSLRYMALSGSCLLCCMADQCRPEYHSRYTGSYPKHSF